MAPLPCRKIPVASAGRYLSPPTPTAAAKPAGSARRRPTVKARVLTRPRPVVVPAASWRSSALVEKRSEEHTSELQSRLHLVCRLLLEKKKKKIQKHRA